MISTELDWGKLHRLYDEQRQSSGLFEMRPFSEQAFRHRFEKNLIPFFYQKQLRGFVLFSIEIDTAVVRFLALDDASDQVLFGHLIAMLEGRFREIEFILYLIPSSDKGQNAFFEMKGYEQGLQRHRLLAETEDLDKSAPVPAPYAVRAYRVPSDRENFCRIMNATFSGLWNHQDVTPEVVAQWDGSPDFDPEGYPFLIYKDQVVGFAAASIGDEAQTSDERVCTLHEIGILPEHRRKGLARNLLGRIAQFAADRSAKYVFLNVDEKNISGAEFYRNAGFKQVYSMNSYVKKGVS